MSLKTDEKKKTKPYVKCYITDELDNTLNTLVQKIGIAKTDVVKAALHEHIKNHYSSYLPKSKNEIENEVKEKYYFEKYKNEFLKQQLMKEAIPGMEKYEKELKERIETNQKKLNTVFRKIEETKDKSKLKDLKKQKEDFEENLERNKKIREENKKRLEEYKQGIWVDQGAPT